MTKNVSSYFNFNLTPLADGVSFIGSSFAASNIPQCIEWLGGAATSQGMMACSAMNALAVSVTNKLCRTSDESTSGFTKVFANIAGLTAGSAVTVAAAKPLAEYTGMMITPSIVAKIAAFNCVVKVIVYSAYRLASTVYRYLTAPNFAEGFKHLTDAKVGETKAHFEKHPDAWGALSLKAQAEFNAILVGKGQEPLEFTRFETEEPLSQQEAEVFATSLPETITGDHAQVLFDAGAAPADRPYQKEELPKVDLTTAEVPQMKDAQVCWCHKAYVANPVTLSEEQRQAFAERFFEVGLEPPTKDFIFQPTTPDSAGDVSKKQAAYFVYYYQQNPKELAKLSLSDQAVLNGVFGKQEAMRVLHDPSTDEMSKLTKGALEVYRGYYEGHADIWDAASSSYQKAFNQALMKQGLEPLDLTASVPTWKKLAVIGAIALVALAGGVYIKTRGDSEAQSPEGTADEGPSLLDVVRQVGTSATSGENVTAAVQREQIFEAPQNETASLVREEATVPQRELTFTLEAPQNETASLGEAVAVALEAPQNETVSLVKEEAIVPQRDIESETVMFEEVGMYKAPSEPVYLANRTVEVETTPLGFCLPRHEEGWQNGTYNNKTYPIVKPVTVFAPEAERDQAGSPLMDMALKTVKWVAGGAVGFIVFVARRIILKR